MNDLNIIDNNYHIKEVFGSFKILDDVEITDHPAIYKFAEIVFNYKVMTDKLNEK